MQPLTSYLICATPRSGSTLLCEALTSTNLAGYPKEYFEALKSTGLPRRPGEYFENSEAKDICDLFGEISILDNVLAHPTFTGDLSYAHYLTQVLEEGTTPNGVFGAKMMWSYFDDFISNVRQIPDYRDMATSDLVSTLFPDLHYIWITRHDKVRQAVSLWKAIQTYTWRLDESPLSLDDPSLEAKELHFHFEAIDHLVQQIVSHEAAWQQYFATNSIQPFTVTYEELVVTYEETALKILSYLHIVAPQKLVFAARRLKQQADSLSEEWVQQYCCLKQNRSKSYSLAAEKQPSY